MRKKLLVIIMLLTCMTLTACSDSFTKTSTENICDTLNSKYIDLEIVETGGSNLISGVYYIVKDKNTNVLYFCTVNGDGNSNITWTPILNSDGSPKLYGDHNNTYKYDTEVKVIELNKKDL